MARSSRKVQRKPKKSGRKQAKPKRASVSKASGTSSLAAALSAQQAGVTSQLSQTTTSPQKTGFLHWAKIALLVIFALSRIYIWIDRPVEFTEILYSYMPYAHLWAGGTTPYLEQWYEYPPATIPLFYLPHVVDRGTLGTPYHLDYLESYRLELLLFDVGTFALIWWVLQKRRTPFPLFASAVLYYIAATAKAHHFIYDTMDMAFAAALTLGVLAPELWKGGKGIFAEWFGYFLAIAFKLLNGPMGLIYAILERHSWKKVLLWGGLAGAAVWGVPLLLYRSSLSVMLVFHQLRGLQVDSAGAIIVRTLDSFAKSEQVIEVYKNYETAGPLTDTILQVLGVLFPLALAAYIGYGSYLAWNARENQKQFLRISLTLGYILLLMIVGKVLSRPFMLWHIPLLAAYPFVNLKEQWKFLVPSLIAVSVTMTYIPDFQVGIFRMALFVGIARTVSFALLFYFWWVNHRQWLKLDQIKS